MGIPTFCTPLVHSGM